jgi:hypothetical protein
MIKAEGTKRSPLAQEVARWATLSYELALILIAVGLVVAATFAALSPEPLTRQLTNVVLLGIVPVLLTYLTGCLAYWVLMGTSRVYDPTIMALKLTYNVLANFALIGFNYLVLPAISISARRAEALASNLLFTCLTAAPHLLDAAGRYFWTGPACRSLTGAAAVAPNMFKGDPQKPTA